MNAQQTTTPDTETCSAAGPDKPCALADTALVFRADPVVGRRLIARRIVPCRQTAVFEVLTRCAVEGNQASHPIWTCAEHEQLMREHPEMVLCPSGHPSLVVAVLPIGGGAG